MSGIPAWRLVAFAGYLVIVAAWLYAVVRLVRAFPGPAFGLFLGFLALALAWPHRHYLRALVRL